MRRIILSLREGTFHDMDIARRLHRTSPVRRGARVISCAAVSAALSTGCTPMPAPAQQPTGIAFELATGGVAQVAGSPTRLRVASIADSRCPSDVTCVWAGDAVVVIVRSGAGESRSDTLHLRAEPHAVAGVGGEWVELLDVRPYPRSTETSPVRVAVLRVRRGQ